ncbi:MAG: hypothetical protein HPY64_08595 [Anaerolineae bacterium]|nr:hypothetical protein [Anaerolineae bacterium]
MTWQEQLAAIMLDHTTGATGLALATAEALSAFLDEDTSTSLQALTGLLQTIAQQILTAQSGMASLVTLFNQTFFALDSASTLEETRQQLRAQLKLFRENLAKSQQSCSRLAAALIAPDTAVMTHSASSTVTEALLRATKQGCALRAIVTESRPLYEGRQLSERLNAAGIEVTVTIDAAAYANLITAGIVLLGADSLTLTGVVSKIGSAGIAVCARTLGVPCYFLADLARVWPAALGEQPIHERAASEVWPEVPGGVRVQNRYFDLTPWSAVCGVVTEEGVLTPEQVQHLCLEREVHPLLQSAMAVVRSSL